MNDDDWAKLYQEYNYVKALEFKNLNTIIEIASKKALYEVSNAIIESLNNGR